ncbi:hypothetical protein RSAG8_00761, partial [Rhizoctonia solani AG-8 WAC10335]
METRAHRSRCRRRGGGNSRKSVRRFKQPTPAKRRRDSHQGFENSRKRPAIGPKGARTSGCITEPLRSATEGCPSTVRRNMRKDRGIEAVNDVGWRPSRDAKQRRLIYQLLNSVHLWLWCCGW